jgi:hypothetical protein
MPTPITLPENYNYIGVFLTLQCNLRCSYCINHFGDLTVDRRLLSGREWVQGLNRIVALHGLPITLQGGEPTLHPDFHAIINGVRPDLNFDLLTNLETDLDLFIRQIHPGRMLRDAPYASIRVSYHPELMAIEALADKVRRLLDAGYSIGIWGLLHPLWKADILRAQDYCRELGIDFRTKEFLGEFQGVMYGEYTYPEAVDRQERRNVECRTSELLIGPCGDLFRCHADLYEGRASIGHILDPAFVMDPGFRACSSFGFCNPCDVKLKTNRFQTHGHTSVEIREFQ